MVGKAATMLYVLLGVKEVYADVMSEQATAAIDDPHEALRAIKTKLAELKNSNR